MKRNNDWNRRQAIDSKLVQGCNERFSYPGLHSCTPRAVPARGTRARAFLTLGPSCSDAAWSEQERPGLKKTNGRQIWAGRFLCALPITGHPRTARGNAGPREECVALNGFSRLNLSRSRYTPGICLARAPNPDVTSTNISVSIVDINNVDIIVRERSS